MLVLQGDIPGRRKNDIEVGSESVRNSLHYFERRVAHATLYAADVCAIERCPIS